MSRVFSDTRTIDGNEQTVTLPDGEFANVTIKAEQEVWFNLGDVPALTSPNTGNFKLESGASWTGTQLKARLRSIRFKGLAPGGNVSVIAWSWLLAILITVNPALAQYTPPGGGPVTGNQTLTNGHVWVGNASNKAADVGVSGDVTLTNTGATTVTKINGATPAAVATSGSASDLTTGTLPAAQMPALTGDVTSTAGTTATTVTKINGATPAAVATTGSASDLSTGTLPAGRMPALTGDVTSSAGSTATTLPTVNSNVGTFTNATVTVNGKGQVTAASSGAAAGNVSFGGNGSDGAQAFGTTTIDTKVLNATTLTINSSAGLGAANSVLQCTGALTFTNGASVIRTTGTGAQQTGVGVASSGGYGATAASSLGTNGYGPAPGQGGNSGASIGPGGGAGAAASGGNGGGATIASNAGEGGLNGAGTSRFGGFLNGSGGGGGGSGASGTGGNGGGGASHLTIVTAGGITAAGGGSITAIGSDGAAGATLGSGGGGGGGGTVELFSSSGNIPAITISVKGGNGGASVSTAANSGGGGGGYICGTVSGTNAATLTVTAGSAGTGGSGTAGSAGGTGLANLITSTTPTLPFISYNRLNNNLAGKNMCFILLARKAIRGEDFESEKAHTFIWDGERHQERTPVSYIAATYAAKGKFDELCMALKYGGDASTANLCDASNIEQCKGVFEQFRECPIKGTMPLQADICDDPDLIPRV